MKILSDQIPKSIPTILKFSFQNNENFLKVLVIRLTLTWLLMLSPPARWTSSIHWRNFSRFSIWISQTSLFGFLSLSYLDFSHFPIWISRAFLEFLPLSYLDFSTKRNNNQDVDGLCTTNQGRVATGWWELLNFKKADEEVCVTKLKMEDEEMGKTFTGDLKSGFLPCTPNGCIKLIEKTGVKVLFHPLWKKERKK